MKRHGNLFEKIIDKDNIRLAHKNARKGKTFYSEVKDIDLNLENTTLMRYIVCLLIKRMK